MQIEVYNELQLLKEFVLFIAEKEQGSSFNETANQVIKAIKGINNPATFTTWDASINIFDRALQDRSANRQGIFWRSWSIFCENNSIEITAKSSIENIPENDIFEGHFSFQYFLSLNDENASPVQTAPIADFIADAKKYHTYITEYLNDVAMDIYIS